VTDATADLLLVGGGLAATRVVQGVRQHGFAGRITMLTDESVPPYDRPPLSKELLLHPERDQPVWLLEPEQMAALDVEIVMGSRASSLDVSSRTVRTEHGAAFGYERLVVATGCRPRRLDVLPDGPNIHYLRTVDDLHGLREALRPDARIAVVGAGFIGLEVTAAAVAAGCQVTVIEVAAAPLAHVLGDEVARFVRDWHENRGVTFRCDTTVACSRMGAHTPGLELSTGEFLIADHVVVGVGVERDLRWLGDAGLDMHVGLVCDAHGRTSAADVYGAGDISCRHVGDRCSAVQHWTSAAHTAQVVARTITDTATPLSTDDAYFWSFQGDLRMQSVGHYAAGADVHLATGSFTDATFVATYVLDGEVTGVIGVNSPREFVQQRRAFQRQLVL
jgi:3-phenylpropionate/trans-cinnamate dioxygenase ferredoxin reductase subunit